MALSPAFFQSAAATFHRQFSPPTVLFPASACRRPSRGLLVIAMAPIVRVDKSEAEKVHRLKSNYLEKIIPMLKEEFNYTNVHEVPKLEKIVVNCGIGDAAQNAKGYEAAMNELALVTGQRPVKTRAKNSVATFKIREGQAVGLAVTLRGKLMYYFLDRLINLGLPRTRDFQGVSPNSFDGNGNYCVGIDDQTVFPDLNPEKIGNPRGMDVCIVTTAETDKEARRLLALMGMPFREDTGASAPVVRKKKLKPHHFAKTTVKGGKKR